MADVTDVDDVFLSAKAEVDTFFDEFMAEWFKPYTDLAIVMLMQNIPPEVKEQLKLMAPDAYKSVQEILDRAKVGGA